jgi:MFS family permease
MLPSEIKRMVPYYPATALGLVTGLTAFVALLVPLVVGAFSDRCASKWGRRRPYMAWGVGINLVGLALMAATIFTSTPIGRAPTSPHETLLETILFVLTNQTFFLFLLSYTVVQLGNNIASAAFSGVIPDLVSQDQRGTASGFMALMTQVGTVSGLILVGLALKSQSELFKYALLSVVFLSVAMVTLFGIRENPLSIKPPKLQWKPYVRSLWISPKKYPDFAWVWVTRALVMLGFYSVLPFLNYFLGDVVRVKDPNGFMTYLSAAILVLAAISGIVGGMLSDRVGRKKVVYIANGLIAVISLAFIFCRTPLEVMTAAAFFGLGYGAYISVDWALGADVLPSKKDAAKEMGIWHISMTLPQAIAAPLTGLLIESFGKTTEKGIDGPVVHYTANGYAAMFVLCSACFGLGAYLIKNVRSVR